MIDSRPAAERNFNPRSPHGERPAFCSAAALGAAFQSTLPARGATINPATMNGSQGISIHAPRTGSDFDSWDEMLEPGNFNPRSPHGERLETPEEIGAGEIISIHAPRTGSDDAAAVADGKDKPFQSTLPARGATVARQLVREPLKISIHAPRTGSDPRE